MQIQTSSLHIIAIDCCEHILSSFRQLSLAQLTSLSSARGELASITFRKDHIDLIVIGLAQNPIRRLFIGHLSKVFSDTPMLILRRDLEINLQMKNIRGEFILSDQKNPSDCKIVEAIRDIFPLAPCTHTHKSQNYNLIREVIEFVIHHLKEEDLSIDQVARKLDISPIRLSRILNKQVGIGFRQLLRQARIEEAKTLLDSRVLSVKEVAAQVGFSDSHYFSRSFKQVTGLSPSEYRIEEPIIY